MHKIDSFPSEDGHIESILIGADVVKVSFQTWNCRQLLLIFHEVDSVEAYHAVNEDIGEYKEVVLTQNRKQYEFYSLWEDRVVLMIKAQSLELYQVGSNGEINSALFDVGYDYIGGQEPPSM